jgi:hypothetical protein
MENTRARATAVGALISVRGSSTATQVGGVEPLSISSRRVLVADNDGGSLRGSCHFWQEARYGKSSDVSIFLVSMAISNRTTRCYATMAVGAAARNNHLQDIHVVKRGCHITALQCGVKTDCPTRRRRNPTGTSCTQSDSICGLPPRTVVRCVSVRVSVRLFGAKVD